MYSGGYFKKQLMQVPVGAPGTYRLLVQYSCPSNRQAPVLTFDILTETAELRKTINTLASCVYSGVRKWGKGPSFTVTDADSAKGSVWVFMEAGSSNGFVTRAAVMAESVLAPSGTVLTKHPFFADVTSSPSSASPWDMFPCSFYGTRQACITAGCQFTDVSTTCAESLSEAAFIAEVQASAVRAENAQGTGAPQPAKNEPAPPCAGLSPLGCSFDPGCRYDFVATACVPVIDPACTGSCGCTCAEAQPTQAGQGTVTIKAELLPNADWCKKQRGCDLVSQTAFDPQFNATVEESLCGYSFSPATKDQCEVRRTNKPIVTWNDGDVHAGCFTDDDDEPFGYGTYSCYTSSTSCRQTMPSEGIATLPKQRCSPLSYCPAVVVASTGSGGASALAGTYIMVKEAADAMSTTVSTWRKVAQPATASTAVFLRIFRMASTKHGAVLLQEPALSAASSLAVYAHSNLTIADVALIPAAIAVSEAEIVKVSTEVGKKYAYGTVRAEKWIPLGLEAAGSLAGLSATCMCPMPQTFAATAKTPDTVDVVLTFPQSFKLLLAKHSQYHIIYRQRGATTATGERVTVDVRKGVPTEFARGGDGSDTITYSATLKLKVPLAKATDYVFWVDSDGVSSSCAPMGAPDALVVAVATADNPVTPSQPVQPGKVLGAVTMTSASLQTISGRSYVKIAWTAECSALPDVLFDIYLDATQRVIASVSAANAAVSGGTSSLASRFQYAVDVSALAAKEYQVSVRYRFASSSLSKFSGGGAGAQPGAVTVTNKNELLTWAVVVLEVESAGLTDVVLKWAWYGAGSSTPKPDGFVILGSCLDQCSLVHTGSTYQKQVANAAGTSGTPTTTIVSGLRPDSTYTFSVVSYAKMTGGAHPCLERVGATDMPPGTIDCIDGAGPVLYGNGAAEVMATTAYAAPDDVHHAPTIISINVTNVNAKANAKASAEIVATVVPIEECHKYVFEVTSGVQSARAKMSSSVAVSRDGGLITHVLPKELFVPGTTNRVRVYAMAESTHLGKFAHSRCQIVGHVTHLVPPCNEQAKQGRAVRWVLSLFFLGGISP